MLDVNYHPKMIEKAKRIVNHARSLPVKHMEKKNFVKEFCGLGYDYLAAVGKSYMQPSNRTLMNLGYELYAKDLATGEMLLLEMNLKCDWNPANPRMNPTSSSLSVEGLVPISTTKE